MGLSSDELWLNIVKEGVEDRVEVNQRMLIDKMLSRYSSEFVVYRELIQNSDDAQSTSFTLQINCDVSTSTQTYESINKDSLSQTQRKVNPLLESLGQLIKSPWNSNKTKSNDSIVSSQNALEDKYNDCIITEIHTINDGAIFNDDDWKRVITIAEGNTNVDAIGQFGVGFFSVFSYSERPMIQSGKYCLAFSWQNGKSLTTFRKELSPEQQTSLTSIILPMKNKFLIETKSTYDKNENLNRMTKSKKNTVTNEIIPTMDITQLKVFFTKVLSFTKHINELKIKINDDVIFQVNKTSRFLKSTKLSLAAKRLNTNNEHSLLHFNSFIQTEQVFSILNGPSIVLNHIDVQAKLNIDPDFHQQIQNVIKKRLPPVIHIQYLFPSNNIFEDEQWKALSINNLNNFILKELIPLKYSNETIRPSGQIFIGLATHQTTGIGMHIFSHLIPTIERENIDLQDPYVSIWNEQLLMSIGKIIRFIYDQTIIDAVNQISQQTHQHLNAIMSPYAFQTSAPNKDIGRILLDGFFSSNDDILVPVRGAPSDKHLSLSPSTDAFLTNSKYIESFLHVPLVPYNLGQNDFFRILKQRRWIEEMTNDIILVKIQQSVFSFDEFIELLRWLCTNEIIKNRNYVKQALSKIHYRQQSTIVKLENIEYYDTLNIQSIPLPSNVLPSNIADYIARDDLQKRLSLTAVTHKILIQHYLDATKREFFQNANYCRVLLSLMSQYLNQFNENELSKIKTTLSNIKCIPTNQGVKHPNESYIPSANLSSDLSAIDLFIPELEKENVEKKENPVSILFLKSIGCRTIDLQSNNLQTTEDFVRNLLDKRQYMSDNDLHALRTTQCLTGVTYESNMQVKRQFKPNDLHFPSVGNRLQWKQLPIVDWENIDVRSREYSFLKELGVRESPELNKLILRIEQEHQNLIKTIKDYKLPNALVFLAENFQQYYSKQWKNSSIKTAFLPSSFFHVNQSTDVILLTPENVFKESGPLCAALLPEVVQCFSQYFDINLLGVKNRPTLPIAFNILIDKKTQILNVETAQKYFSYFYKLDGLNQAFAQKIANIPFIPLLNKSKQSFYVQPSQVFIRSKSDKSTDENSAASGLIDYVDYGQEANSFLISIGVLHYPTVENLANLLIERQAAYFHPTKDDTEEILSAKVQFYINCLKQIAAVANMAQQLYAEPLRTRLTNKPWCLAYQIVKDTNGSEKRNFKIAKPMDIYLDDDHQSSIDLRPLCAPDEPELIKLYETFGSKWISECVRRTLVHRGKLFITDRSKKLRDLIDHRLDMLFVNNRGELMKNINEKCLNLLRTSFSVYETEGIECQLTFQNQTITLNSTECSSCALEYDKSKVILFIHKSIPNLDYIDIATELTRFVYKKPLDSLVHSISDKLASPLETLKRRGIPVDRLLKSPEQQQIKLAMPVESKRTEENKEKPPVLQQSLTPHYEQQQLIQQQLKKQQLTPKSDTNLTQDQAAAQSFRGLIQNFRELLTPTATDPVKNLSSTVEQTRVHNFGQYKSTDDADISKMIRTARPYSQNEFTQQEHSRNEVNNSCEYVPASNMIRYEYLLCEIPLYVDRNVTITNGMIEQGQQLAWLLSGLAKQVFQIPVQTIHLFRDIDSARIAFNSNGALFFNLRYYEQVFADDLKPYLDSRPISAVSTPLIRTVVNFYYIVACHELAHNLDSNHDLNFINRLENVSVRFMDAKDAFLSKFSF